VIELTIGDRLKLKRKKMAFTLEEISQKVGISRQTLSRYETGVIANIPSDNIEKIAKALNTTPAYLMGWEDNTNSEEDEVWELRDMLHKRPEMKTLLHASQKVTREDIEKVSALMDSLKKMNPEFGENE
jgi:repressor LexA